MGSYLRTVTSVTIVLLLLLFFAAHCSAVMCYVCIWMSHNTGVVSDERVDNCRPGSFNRHDVMVDSCPNGCAINVLHQNDLDMEITGNRSIQQWSNCTTNAVLMNITDMSMTMYKRMCSDKPVNRDHCHVTYMTGFREDKKYCHTDYCNGDSGSKTIHPTSTSLILTQLGIGLLSLCAFYVLPNIT